MTSLGMLCTSIWHTFSERLHFLPSRALPLEEARDIAEREKAIVEREKVKGCSSEKARSKAETIGLN